MINIVAYCRVSTDKEDQLNSLKAQKQFFKTYAEKNNLNLLEIYADEGISGTKIKNRHQLQKLIRDAQKGMFTTVVVKDVSRLARNTVDFLNTFRELKRLGVKVLFVNYNMDSEEVSEFMLTIMAAIAQEESHNTSIRVKSAKKANAEQGRVPNLAYGYDKIKGDYFNLYINEAEAEVVRRIFDMYLNQGNGANKIAIILNSEGMKTKRNCVWSQNAIIRILTNRLYTGIVTNGKQEVKDFLTGERQDIDESEWFIVEKPELKIIEQEDFDMAQKILSDRHRAFKLTKERQSNKYLFSTMIRCKCCGYSFRRNKRDYAKTTSIKWVCSGRNAKGKDSCPNNVSIDETELIESIKGYFGGILKDKPKLTNDIMREFNRLHEEQTNTRTTVKELKDQLKELRKQKEKETDMYRMDIYSQEELMGNIAPINSRIKKIENELKFIQCEMNMTDSIENILNQTIQNIEDMVNMEFMTNTMIRRVIEKIEVDQDGDVKIHLKLISEIGLDNEVHVSYDNTYRSNKHERLFIVIK